MNHISFEKDDHIARIVLNRPEKLNTVTPQMIEDICCASENCNTDKDIRVVVITGAGDKAFCAGSDVTALKHYETEWDFRNRLDYCDAIRGIRKPVIAAINGYAYGGGLEISLSCDIRIAADNATFCAAEIKLGWIGGGGVSFYLVHNIGAGNAARMLFTGTPVDAETARRWGLVSEITSSDELMPTAIELAISISKNAPIAAQTAKANIQAAFRMSADDAVAYERDLQTICMATEDADEGRQAFAEKREPVFRGK